MKKKIVAIFAAVFAISTFAFAQVSVDPDEEFYNQVERWEILGIIDQQPPLRPYAVNKVQEILETVINSNNEKESLIAKELHEKYYSKFVNAYIDVQALGRFSNKEEPEKDLHKKELQGTSVFNLNGDIKLSDYFAFSYKVGGVAEANVRNLGMYATLRPYSLQDDPGLPGPIHPYLETDTTASLIFNNFTVMAGINHSSFGPFFGDNIVLSSSSKHNGSLAIVFNRDKFTFTEGMFILRAQTGNGGNYPTKYLFLQSADYNLNKYVSFSIYDASVYGERFDPAYLIPCPFIITEGITGYNEDNIFLGATLTVRPFNGLAWKSNFYVDDAGFEKFKEYKDVTLRAAFQTGVTYIPEQISWLDKVDLNYTFVTPYMYTHIAHYGWTAPGGFHSVNTLDQINYQVYDSAGQALATALEPDSDRIALKATFNPIKNLTINTGFNFIRHGNVNETLTTEEQAYFLVMPKGSFTSNGGILNHSYCPGAKDLETSNWYKIMLLTQEHIQYTYQGNINAEYKFPKTKAGQFALQVGYGFEYIHNYGVGNEMFKGYSEFTEIESWAVSKDGSPVTESNIDYEKSVKTQGAADAVKAQYEAWVNNLTDIFNNYLTLKVIYRF